MANPHRGEVEMKAPSGTFTLRLSINAIAEIENLLDQGINEIAASLADASRMRLATLRAIVWGGLRENHPDLTLFAAGDLISEVGVDGITDAVQQAFTLAFPKADDDSPPPKAGQGGTGKAS